MKEITKDFKENEVSISEERQEKKTVHSIGKQRKIPGLTTWEYNGADGSLNPAKYKTAHVDYNSPRQNMLSVNHNATTHFTIDAKPNCYYFQALNKKNAVKHLRKIGMIK